MFRIFAITTILIFLSSIPSIAGRSNRMTPLNAPESGLTPSEDRSPNIRTGHDGPASLSLGSYSTDGGSPGQIVFRSYCDWPVHYNPGRLIAWRGNSTPQMHMVYTAQATPGLDMTISAQWLHYNMFDPTVSPNGVWINGASGVGLNPNPLVRNSLQPQIDVDNTGHAVISSHTQKPDYSSVPAMNTEIWLDVGAATFMSDTIPPSLSYDPLGPQWDAKAAFQEHNGSYITHVIARQWTQIDGEWTMGYGYWRREGGPGTIGTWQVNTPPAIASTAVPVWGFVVASPVDPKVAIVWSFPIERDIPYDTYIQDNVYVIESPDMGLTWGEAGELINYTPEEDHWQAYKDVTALYDSDGYLHVAFQAMLYSAASHTAWAIDPCRIFHWTNRLSGSVNGGTMSVVAHIANDFEIMCGRAGPLETNVGRTSLAECNDRLYLVYQRFANTDEGDYDDCVDASVSQWYAAYNSELYLSVSLSQDGSLWDKGRNLTNSHTPGCDGSEGNECDDDRFPTVSRYGMNSAPSVIGPTYWASASDVFNVRDNLFPSYPDSGHFLDVMYINDLLTANAGFASDFSNNPIKWFRLPCIPPMIKPIMLTEKTGFLHPRDWVLSGQEVSFDITIENLGNADLDIHTVSVEVVSGHGLIDVSEASLNVPTGSVETVTVVLNPGGTAHPIGGEAIDIDAYVVFESNDIDNPVDSFHVRTVITDEVVAITPEIIRTGLGLPISVLNNGTAGNSGMGGNLGFFEEGGISIDCDSQEVYLYDLSPIVMTDPDHYSWSPYWDYYNIDPVANFLPIPTEQPAGTTTLTNFEQYKTQEFATADSSLGMRKVWVAPTDSVSFLIEKWEIYARDGQAHAGVYIGEWVDMDVPADTLSNNAGAVVEAEDYLYVWGQESDGDLPCVLSNARFYVSGLLGHYWASELRLDSSVNHRELLSVHVLQSEDLMNNRMEFLPDTVWQYLTSSSSTVNNSGWDDQRSLISVGQFDFDSVDTLVIWLVHGSLYNSSVQGVADLMVEARVWYQNWRGKVDPEGCCGEFTGGFTGNTDCDTAGKRNLADITRLIDRVYVSKIELCCEENGNIDGDLQAKINLSDITSLIDHVYVRKAPTAVCY